MLKISTIIVAFIALLAQPVFAGTIVIEGDEAKKLYAIKKNSAKVLAQKDKVFIYRTPDGKEEPKVKKITVKVGEEIFLLNEEEKYVHNVYDSTDDSWVLKKQKPSEVAIIKFDSPGVHKLKCAIHPKMKVKVTVE